MKKIDKFVVGDDSVKKSIVGGEELVIIAGPCAIENEKHALMMAEKMMKITEEVKLPFIYKSCFDKDCRSSPDSYHGCGIDKGLKILEKVRSEFKIPVTTDVSNVSWMNEVADVVDMIQIPAYLCRQTHLLREAAKTKKPIHLKKGQYMNPANMKNSLAKIFREENYQVLLTDRGTFFGYGDLINDFRSLQIMKSFGTPVCYDATHSIQMPTGAGSVSQGAREFIPGLVRAACAMGIDSLFLEVHDNPDEALSDPATQLNLKYFKNLISQAKEIYSFQKTLIDKFPLDDIS